jgi:signal peptidase I
MSSSPTQRPESGDPPAGADPVTEALDQPAAAADTGDATTATHDRAPGSVGGEPAIEASREQKPGKPGKSGHGALSFLQELPVLLVIAFVLALLIKTFLMQAFYIPSESMEPTLNVGDRVLVNKVVYHLHPPRRGDIIVFADPNPGPQPHRNAVSAFWHWLTEGLGVATSPEKDFIKRVIGLPGDLVECRNGAVFINGERLNEPYIAAEDDRECGPVRVPANMLFVLGDNRLNSRDSRYGLGVRPDPSSQIGFIPYDKVIGRAFVIIWPPSHMGWLRGS